MRKVIVCAVLCSVAIACGGERFGAASSFSSALSASSVLPDIAGLSGLSGVSSAAQSAAAAAASDATGAGTMGHKDEGVNPIFYDRPLMLKQYGYGMGAGLVAGALGFYIGNAFEGAIFGGNSRKGYLSFTGIRYEHSRRFLGMPAGGPFIGGSLGLLGGSAMTVFFVGDSDEEQGSVLLTAAGGALTTVAAFMLADALGVEKDRGMLPFIPLLALPPLGAVGGYHVSRWFNDRKRHRITEEGAQSGLMLHAPRFGMAPGGDGMVMRLDALHLTF